MATIRCSRSTLATGKESLKANLTVHSPPSAPFSRQQSRQDFIERLSSHCSSRRNLASAPSSLRPLIRSFHTSVHRRDSKLFEGLFKTLPDGALSPHLPNHAFIALGSNIGDRFRAIEDACISIDADDDMRIVETSPLYETAPMYVEDQGNFLNGVCKVCENQSWLFSRCQY
jgi:2-amino-4-hydroxy-6-hydroxymethyldihydropteridine diphosphokinase/dihydropteroate synthase